MSETYAKVGYSGSNQNFEPIRLRAADVYDSKSKTLEEHTLDSHSHVKFGVTNTVTGTAEKIVDSPDFVLGASQRILVLFTFTNSAANPKLNVNNTGAKPIYYRNAPITPEFLAANKVYEFVYNGSQYVMIGDVTEFATQTEANELTVNHKVISPATIPKALTTQQGVIQVATQAETNAGTMSNKALSPATAIASNTNKGVMAIATQVEVTAGTVTDKVVAPNTLKFELDKKVNKNSDITAATKTKITYDTKGLVTGGTDLVLSDLPRSATANRLLRTAAANSVPIWSLADLTTDVTGILPVANGGTGVSTVSGASATQRKVFVSPRSTTAAAPYFDTLNAGDVGLGNVKNVDTTNATNIDSGTLDDARLTSNVVLLTGGQTISGNKIFSGTTTFTGNIIANSQTITPTQLGYISGITSNIQTQIDNKTPLNTTLSDNAGSRTLPVTTSGTIVSKIQALRNNVKQAFSEIDGKQATIFAGTTGRLLTSSGTAGTVNELDSTVGSTTMPVYINAGVPTTLTQSNLRIGIFGTTAIGSATQPVYFAANGVPTAGNSIPTTLPPSGSAGGELSGTYPNPTLTNAAVTGKVLTGLTSSTTELAATDTIVTAFGKAMGRINSKLSLTGGTLTNFLTLHANPTADSHAATKSYVDSVAQGLDIKLSCRVATTVNITLSGIQTIDGITLVAGDRVLVKNQTTASANGIYVVASGAWSRATDANTNAKVTSGMFTFIEQGSVNDDSGWVLSTPDPITLGTTALSFSQFSGAGQITAGTGLTKSGNTLSLTNVGTAGTYRSVTTDAQGRITAGTNPTTLSGYGITDATPSSHIGSGGSSHANVVSNGSAGFMTGADKQKLDNIATGANNYTHPTSSGNKHIPSGGSSGQILRWSADGTATWGTDNNTTYSAATTSTAGLMSAADKTKLDGITTGANKTTVENSLTSTSTTNALSAAQGKALNDGKVDKVSGKQLSTEDFTSTLLTKLNGITAGANNYTHPTTAGNKHIPSGGESGQILRWSADGTAAWGTDNNTTYSAMSVSEGQTATATTSRVVRADYLKQIIDHHITNANKQDALPTGGTTSQYLRGNLTLSTFMTDVRATTITSPTLTDSTIATGETLQVVIGKLQAQVTSAKTSASSKETAITAGTTAQYWRGDKVWTDFATTVRACALTGLSTATNSAITATDTVLSGMGKLQSQVNSLKTGGSGAVKISSY